MSAVIPASTQAQAFVHRYADYFFQDAHFQVEAAAATEAVEVAPNQFRFRDGSWIEFQHDTQRVLCRRN
jgi:hypothetical protein